jgi:2,4-dienoyl-CoA reductase-like NADH-dependent reductase (Old Yellow Enzyme family)
MAELEHLFSPLEINGMELSNRAVMPAMGTGYGGTDGSVTDRLTAYLARRARGGVGLLITEVCAIDPRGRGFPTEIGAWSDDQLDSLARIPEAVHHEGSRVALQLHHAGRETMEVFAGAPPEAPSSIPSAMLRQPCEEMTSTRIAEVLEAYAAAAARAREAGYDAVEVHGAHGYLINQFLSPFSNRREDEYGGSDENRSRFALEVLTAVRDRVGPGFPIIIRVSVEEAVQGGYGTPFMEWLAPRLVEAGADCIHASVGVISTPGGLTIASMDTKPGFNLPRARAVRSVVDVPVIGVGRINDPRLADEAIARGDADLVSFGRQHLSDPDFLAKARRGAYDDIRWCLSCNQGCIERLSFELKPITCTVNPECGEEYRGEPALAGHPLRVWVIGGGPAGLSAAMSAVERGHAVELFERGAYPGGQLIPASRPPNKSALSDWVGWASRRLEMSGVPIHTGCEVTAADLSGGGPERAVVATGARTCIPSIPGIDEEYVVDARDLLMRDAPPVPFVVIIGAGYVGMETADYLVAGGVKVTVLETDPQPPVSRLTTHGYWMHKRLRDSGGILLLGACVTSIGPETVTFVQDGLENTLEHSGLVVNASGAVPESGILAALESAGIPYSVAGDARTPRRLIEAIHEGHAAGLAV